MWIRHQNNICLGKYTSFCVLATNQIYGMQGPDDDGAMLGSYESQERAIEVLDEMQALIKNSEEKVFNMPKR